MMAAQGAPAVITTSTSTGKSYLLSASLQVSFMTVNADQTQLVMLSFFVITNNCTSSAAKVKRE